MENTWISFLKSQVKPALGCTEPIAVALAVAWARRQIPGELERLDVAVSPSVYKNGFRVTIPGTTETGNQFAAALAWVAGNPDYSLEVLCDARETDYDAARAILDKVTIRADHDKNGVYVEAAARTDKGDARAVIAQRHDRLEMLAVNGRETFRAPAVETATGQDPDIGSKTLKDLREVVESLDPAELEFLLEGVDMNYGMAEASLVKEAGLGVGRGIQKLLEAGQMENSLINEVRMISAAATDGRMGGLNLPVMSSAGSGNHGITAILPVYLVARSIGAGQEKLLRALALSHLVTSYVKVYTGRLSPVCGCGVAAGAGAAGAIAWLLSGKDAAIAQAIHHMIASLAGMLCDGAKAGCALKISTAAAEAVLAAFLAAQSTAEDAKGETGGIVSEHVERSIRNLGKVSTDGLNHMDDTLLTILEEEASHQHRQQDGA